MKNLEEIFFFILLGITALIGVSSYIFLLNPSQKIFILNKPLNYFNVTSCGIFNQEGIYILEKNISSNSTCFFIKTDNSILDCKGYTIIGNRSSSAIEVFGSNNKIRNCIFKNFIMGVNFKSGFNNTLSNNLLSIDF